MAFPSYTYTFTNGSTADATQVDQNFSDILNGISDTTKDISVKAITAAGTTTLSGDVTLGASTSNTITFNGKVGSSIPVGVNTSYDFGSATLGLRSVYIGGTSTFTTRIMGAATASWTLTLPTTAGTGLFFLQTDGSGVTSWANISEPTVVQNLGLLATVATNALTIALKTASGADPSASSPVTVSFRNSTSATGQYSAVSQTAALSIVVPSSATLGQTSAINQYVWVYLINDAGTLDLAVSGVNVFDDLSTQSSTQISSGATSGTVLYSGSSHSGAKAIRLIGRLLVSEATAGTWASAPSEVSLMPVPRLATTDPIAFAPVYSGMGSVSLNSGFYWRVGKMLNFYGSVTTGTLSASQATISLPSLPAALSLDPTWLSINNTSSNPGMVVGDAAQASANLSGYLVTAPATSALLIYVGAARTANGVITPQVGTSTWMGNNNVTSLKFSVPIAGWSQFGP